MHKWCLTVARGARSTPTEPVLPELPLSVRANEWTALLPALVAGRPRALASASAGAGAGAGAG